MFTRVLNAFRLPILLYRVDRLCGSGKYDDALSILGKLPKVKSYADKITLFRADILYRKGNAEEGIREYEEFLHQEGGSIKNDADRRYLLLYARYFMENAKRTIDRGSPLTIKRSEVEALSRQASFVTRNEFRI